MYAICINKFLNYNYNNKCTLYLTYFPKYTLIILWLNNIILYYIYIWWKNNVTINESYRYIIRKQIYNWKLINKVLSSGEVSFTQSVLSSLYEISHLWRQHESFPFQINIGFEMHVKLKNWKHSCMLNS